MTVFRLLRYAVASIPMLGTLAASALQAQSAVGDVRGVIRAAESDAPIRSSHVAIAAAMCCAASRPASTSSW
jgi:hypothetical protein